MTEGAIPEPNQGATQDTRRVDVDEAAYQTAEVLARERRTTVSEVFRQAVTTQRWFDDVRAAGGRIIVEKRGRLREILEITESQGARK